MGGAGEKLRTYRTKANIILVQPHKDNGILSSEVLGFFLYYLHDSKFTFIVIPCVVQCHYDKNEIK